MTVYCAVICHDAVCCSQWELPPREDGRAGSAPAQRPYIPFEGKSTTQEAYAPKYVGDDGPVFGAPSNRGGVGSEGPSSRPYIPFEGESVTKSSYPYVCDVVYCGIASIVVVTADVM